MVRKFSFLIISLILACGVGFPAAGLAAGIPAQTAANPGSIGPDNTLILANAADAGFSRDFSTLLDGTRLEWFILENPILPESIQEHNLILLGNPDSPLSGEVIRELANPEQIQALQASADEGVVLEIESPWAEDRTVLVCSGGSSIAIRNAAERALRALIDAAPPASDWLRTRYEAPLDENLQSYLDRLRYSWEDEELSVQDLAMDIAAETKQRISTQEAREDVERLFELFSHGYAGYGFFNLGGDFNQAKTSILEGLSGQSSWTTSGFSDLLVEHLAFIGDCHLKIGEHSFSDHSDFWFDSRYELSLGKAGFQLVSKGTLYEVVSINGGKPEPYIYPSLNQEGDPIYRLGILSPDPPNPLQVIGVNGAEERLFEIKLARSDFDFYAEEIFREDLLGGIPVIRVRGFGDYHRDMLSAFPETAAAYRGDPVVIVDLRGNGGGNESWPVSWIQRLTGRRAEAIFVYSQLESKTSLMGRANAFDFWIETAGIDPYKNQLQTHLSAASAIEDGTRQAGWTGPVYPALPLIPNETTVVIITNGLVASAGEGFVLRASQLENVVVVGENTMGCLTFGNISAHKLPNSNLMVWMPINFGLFPDQQLREGIGLDPDLWVPAADAVNYAVAALRKGTISTALPLSEETLAAEFRPESGWRKAIETAFASWPVIAIFAACGIVWGYFNRRNARILVLVGLAWCFFSLYWILTRTPKDVHFGLLASGVISLAWGLYSLVTVGWGKPVEEGQDQGGISTQ